MKPDPLDEMWACVDEGNLHLSSAGLSSESDRTEHPRVAAAYD
jgi:hypothetical protein